jgi:hypothetical protein
MGESHVEAQLRLGMERGSSPVEQYGGDALGSGGVCDVSDIEKGGLAILGQQPCHLQSSLRVVIDEAEKVLTRDGLDEGRDQGLSRNIVTPHGDSCSQPEQLPGPRNFEDDRPTSAAGTEQLHLASVKQDYASAEIRFLEQNCCFGQSGKFAKRIEIPGCSRGQLGAHMRGVDGSAKALEGAIL